ncbi:hypothetical protein F2P79_024413 [Pimephales promelas]|nr:hypothetical protein F2P79_024413 [Pimephales promelas]
MKINSEGFARWVSDGVHFSFSWLPDASPGGRQDKPFPGWVWLDIEDPPKTFREWELHALWSCRFCNESGKVLRSS